jgi:hypothetical protein
MLASKQTSDDQEAVQTTASRSADSSGLEVSTTCSRTGASVSRLCAASFRQKTGSNSLWTPASGSLASEDLQTELPCEPGKGATQTVPFPVQAVARKSRPTPSPSPGEWVRSAQIRRHVRQRAFAPKPRRVIGGNVTHGSTGNGSEVIARWAVAPLRSGRAYVARQAAPPAPPWMHRHPGSAISASRN